MKPSKLSELRNLAMAWSLMLSLVVLGIPAWAQQSGLSEPVPAAITGRTDSQAKNNALPANSASSPSTGWPPREVNKRSETVANVDCSLPEVLSAASQHLREFSENLSQYTATERFEHQQLKKGKWSAPEIRTFKYVVELHEIRPGMLVAEETRDGSPGLHLFPGGLADLGLPTLALALHPYFLDDDNFTCEGQGEWRGQPAFQIYFQQRADRSPRLRAYVTPEGAFALRLKGRAWISAQNYEVLHVESDLLQPLPEIRLLREHVDVDYGPVRFPSRKVELWLPISAEVYMDFQGRRYRRRHLFSDFLLFSVDVNERVAEPKVP